MLCQVIDHMVMRESQPQATGSGLRRACGRACGSSNLVDDLDLLHASMKIRSSFAECRVQNQLQHKTWPRLSHRIRAKQKWEGDCERGDLFLLDWPGSTSDEFV